MKDEPKEFDFVSVDPESFLDQTWEQRWAESILELQRLLSQHDVFRTERNRDDQEDGPKIGIIVIGGNLEWYDLRNNPLVVDRVQKTDSVVILFLQNCTFPPLQKYGHRKSLAESWHDVRAYYQTPALLKTMVRGFEMQLQRRVVAVGMDMQRKLVEQVEWISVPLTEEERFHGREISDAELLELINFAWAFRNADPDPEENHVEALFDWIQSSGWYVVPMDRIDAAVRENSNLVAEGKRTVNQFDKEVISGLVRTYRGEDPPPQEPSASDSR